MLDFIKEEIRSINDERIKGIVLSIGTCCSLIKDMIVELYLNKK